MSSRRACVAVEQHWQDRERALLPTPLRPVAGRCFCRASCPVHRGCTRVPAPTLPEPPRASRPAAPPRLLPDVALLLARPGAWATANVFAPRQLPYCWRETWRCARAVLTSSKSRAGVGKGCWWWGLARAAGHGLTATDSVAHAFWQRGYGFSIHTGLLSLTDATPESASPRSLRLRQRTSTEPRWRVQSAAAVTGVGIARPHAAGGGVARGHSLR